MSAIVDEKGRILIPKELRDKLGISKGEKLILSVAGSTLLIRKSLDEQEFMQISSQLRKEIGESMDHPIEFEKVF